MGFKKIISRTREIMDIDDRTILERTLKASEELGEMSEAVLSATGSKGCAYKGKSNADIVEEAWDTAICAFSVAIQAMPSLSVEAHEDIIMRKLNKWERKVKEESVKNVK